MRSHTRSRYYVDVPLTEKVEDWSDDRIWDELAIRLGPEAAANITRRPSIEKSIAPLRSYVFEPMRHGSLLLCGDNSAASDIYYLYHAMLDHYKKDDDRGLEGYSARALARVWKAQRFSWWMTTLLHTFPDTIPYDRRLQDIDLEYLFSSDAAMASLSENYVGLPF